MTDLFIAGHGKNRNGSFDSGATGFISKGEHRYMTENLFPAMRKYLPDGVKPVFHTAYNVYNYGDIVSLANNYGSNTRATEFHFDSAMNRSAKGGHVIIHKNYKPDDLDIKLRNAIRDTVGINSAYKHRGYTGLSGRTDLANVNRSAKGGVNYRLLELGFGSNKTDSDYMIKNVDTIAKELVKAFYGKTKDTSKAQNLYKVQVGSFSILDNAKRLRNELIGKGYMDTFVNTKGKLYKVQVGAFNKLDNAKSLRNELIKKGYKDTFIVT